MKELKAIKARYKKREEELESRRSTYRLPVQFEALSKAYLFGSEEHQDVGLLIKYIEDMVTVEA